MATPPFLAVQLNTATDLLDATPTFAPNLIYPYTPPLGNPLVASGTIPNGSLVSLIDVAGTLKAILASANASCSQAALPANGFVLASSNNGQPVQVFLGGLVQASIPGASASSVGSLVYLSDATPGAFSLTAPLPNKIWTPTTHYNLADQIIDGNGNWETVTTAGNSGATEPNPTPPGGGGAWNTVCNGTTPDGTVTWTMSPAHYEQVCGTIVYFNSTTNQCTVNFQPLLNIGDVSSVGLSMPSDFSVGGSPIVTAGTLAVQWLPQNANLVHAGPTMGSPAIPTWRNLVGADFGTAILAKTFLAGPTGSSGAATFRLITVADLPFTGTASATTFARGDGSWSSAYQTIQVETVTLSSLTLANFHGGTGIGITDSGGGTITISTTNGAVSAGTANQIAYYAASGSTISGDSRLTDSGTILAYTGTGGITTPSLTTTGIISVGTVLQLGFGFTDTGISRDSAGVFDFGNGTASDKSGSINLTALTATGLVQAATLTSTGGINAGTNKLIVSSAGLLTTYDNIALTGQGVAVIVAKYDAVTQSAAISAQSLVPTTPVAGQYKVTWSAVVTTPDGTSSTLGGSTGFQVTYTDADTTSSATTPAAGAPSAGTNTAYSQTNQDNTIGTQASGVVVVNATASSAITFSFGYTSSVPGTMVYAIHVKVEYLG